MSNAQQIVAILLEDNRMCAGCQKEFGLTAPPGTSHGFCKRHAAEYYGADMGQMLDEMPPENFCPDLSQQRQ